MWFKWMKNMANSYSIYPSMLDRFYWAKRLGTWDELLDLINRTKKFEKTEKQLKGLRFEKLIDDILNGEVVEQTEFKQELVDKIAYKLHKNIGRQKYIEDKITVKNGIVKLYGYIDFEYDNFYIDLKTTEKYKPGKYEKYSQHKVYPLVGKKESLIYLITDFENIYQEPYPIDPDATDKLYHEINELIEWLEIHRFEITDKKIFTA